MSIGVVNTKATRQDGVLSPTEPDLTHEIPGGGSLEQEMCGGEQSTKVGPWHVFEWIYMATKASRG